MVIVAVWVLTIAVAAGIGLGMWHLRATDAASRPPAAAGILHGIIGAAGLVVLLLALRGPPRGVAAGAASFGMTAAWLFGVALLSGAVFYFRRRKGAAIMLAIHAGVAITGYALLLAWDSVG